MKRYKNMSNKEILNQIEWSDNHEFTYDYSLWAFNEIKRLNKVIKGIEKYIHLEMYSLPPLEYQLGNDLCIYNELLDKLKELKEEGK